MSGISEFDTIAAIATAVGGAGIAKIRLSGKKSAQILSEIFVPYKKGVDASRLESHRIYFGNIVDGDEVVDECMVSFMRAPKSYTREDVAEIDCHGGVSVTYRILNLAVSHGARPAEPGEFTKRAFLNGRIDLSQAEAVMELIGSKNELARKNSVRQLKGGLSEKISRVRKDILYEIAYIESALDDPEHISLEGYAVHLSENVLTWIAALEKMLASYDDGRLIQEGIRTCIVGTPNAGKSSFLNALLGEERAIVTEIAGTTRDTLEETVNIGGITLRLIDTAGIRATEDVVEKIGVEKAKKEIHEADLVLCILDTSVKFEEEDAQILRAIADKKKIILFNKTDVDAAEELSDLSYVRDFLKEDDPTVRISAKYHQGLDEFLRVLKKMMFHGKIDLNDEVYITNARHKNSLEASIHSLRCLSESIENGMPEDFFTIDMMDAYEELGKIIGESVEDDLVNEIFSKFCVGK